MIWADRNLEHKTFNENHKMSDITVNHFLILNYLCLYLPSNPQIPFFPQSSFAWQIFPFLHFLGIRHSHSL
jgi:hypothetical protein